MPEIMHVNRSCSYPWTEEDFRRYRMERNCVGSVAKFDGMVVGFMICRIYKSWIHLDNLVVLQNYRHHGIGTQLLEKMFGKFLSDERDSVFLEVCETNIDAQLFFRKNGFRAISILRNPHGRVSRYTYFMQYELGMPYVHGQSKPSFFLLESRILFL